jgi:hypothetical protein
LACKRNYGTEFTQDIQKEILKVDMNLKTLESEYFWHFVLFIKIGAELRLIDVGYVNLHKILPGRIRDIYSCIYIYI